MPQHKSAEKALRVSKKATIRNRSRRSELRTAVKTVLESKDKETATVALKKAVSRIDKSVDVGIIHKNNASNKKSRLTRFVNKLTK
jgi:small subunit ribosomal protein S20